MDEPYAVITGWQAQEMSAQRLGHEMSDLAALAKSRTGVAHEWYRVIERDRIELRPLAPPL